MNRLKQFLISVDQVGNTIFGSGWADETLSAYAWRKQLWSRPLIDMLFFWEPQHCYNSYLTEKNRGQLPSEYGVIDANSK